MRKRVLIVDDSLYMRSLIKETLSDANFEVVGQAGDGESAIDQAMDLEPDLITLDNILPDMLGLDVIKQLKAENISSKILMISAVGQQSVINAGLELGADDYLVKPFTPETLMEKIAKVLAATV